MPVIDPQSLYQNALAAGRNFWSMAQNSPLGYAVQSTMPRLADALNLHPTATVYSPDYQASRNNLVNPQFLIPGPAAYHSKPLAFARGMASSASNFTSGQNLALMGGMAATGGLLDFLPFVPGVNRMVGLGMAGQAGARTLMNRPHLDPNDPSTYEQAGQWFGDASQAALGLHMAMQPSGFWEAAGTHTTAPGEAGPRPAAINPITGQPWEPQPVLRMPAQAGPVRPAPEMNPYGAPAVPHIDPATGEAVWPSAYTNAPRNLNANGQGGANYTAADLAALKAKYGIADTPTPLAAASARQPLPVDSTASAGYNYMHGLPQPPSVLPKVPLDPRVSGIADAYTAMPAVDPAALSSYDALKQEIKQQYNYATRNLGIKIEPTDEDPYGFNGGTPAHEQLFNDVRNNQHLGVWRGGNPLPEGHPLAEVDPDTGENYNTMFRAIHDLFGHVAQGNDFSELGEENAWNAHRQMMSPEALPAMTTETKGQTSWFFHNKAVREGAPLGAFADQKAALLPSEFYSRPESNVPADDILAAHAKNGGSIFSLNKGNLANQDGFAVSMFPDRTVKVPGQLTAQHIRDFAQQNADVLSHPNAAIGTWNNNGTHWLDVSSVTNDLTTARQLGKKYNQVSIYDLKNNREIPTGGTGEAVPNLPPAAQRLAELKNADPMTLMHWSTQQGLTNLDVSRFGSSTASGAERNRANEPGFLPRVYMGEQGKYFEPRITNRPYQYSGNVSAGRYYDIANDPLGIWQSAYQKGGPTAAENAVKQAGYSGYRGHGVVASFDNVPVQPVDRTVPQRQRTGFWQGMLGNEQGSVHPDVFLAPFEWATKAAAKRFSSVVPPSVAEHLPQGWEDILRTPTSQRSMLDTRASLSSPAEVQAGAQFAQQRGYNWYEKSRMLPQVLSQVDRNFMPEERIPQFLNVGAATSTRTRVPRNLAQTLESWNMLKDEGFPSEKEFVEGLFRNPRTLNPPDVDMKNAKVPNISRAMADEPLGGMKVFSFGGDLNFGHHGTVDTIEGVGLGMKQPEKASQPANYLAGRSILSQAADNMGTDIHQVQSSHWTGIQSTGLLKKNSSLRTADPADVIANMRKNLESAPSMDFASVAIDALEGRHYTQDYARIDRALRQGFGNDETKINTFLSTLKGELEPLNRAAAQAPLGQANSRQLRNFVRRVQQSSANRTEE